MILTCQARYRSPGRSSYWIAVKLGGDESWGRISEEFVHGRRGLLIKRFTSWLVILTCQACYRSPRRSSYQIAVKLGGDEYWGRNSDEFVHGRRGSLIKCLVSYLVILTCQARYRSPGRSSYRIAVKLGGDESSGRLSDEFFHGRRGSLIKHLTS